MLVTNAAHAQFNFLCVAPGAGLLAPFSVQSKAESPSFCWRLLGILPQNVTVLAICIALLLCNLHLVWTTLLELEVPQACCWPLGALLPHLLSLWGCAHACTDPGCSSL